MYIPHMGCTSLLALHLGKKRSLTWVALSNHHQQRLQASGLELTAVQVQGATNALVYSLRDAVANKLEQADLVAKLKGCGTSLGVPLVLPPLCVCRGHVCVQC